MNRMSDYMAAAINAWATERPELDASPMEVTGRLLRAARIIEPKLDAAAATVGLSHKGDLDVLAALRRIGPPHERTPSWLATSVQLTTGGMTNRLDRLERAGLVERRPDPSDRRGVLVRLTDKGKLIADDAFELVLTAQAKILAEMSTDARQTLAKSLESLLLILGDVDPHS